MYGGSDGYIRLALLATGVLPPSVLLLLFHSRLCTHVVPVNTAARMCKFSNRTESGSIRCSVQVGSHPSLAQNPDVVSVSQGFVSIKGKGKMQVYDVLFTGNAQATESNTSIAQTLSRPTCTLAPESRPFRDSACAQQSPSLSHMHNSSSNVQSSPSIFLPSLASLKDQSRGHRVSKMYPADSQEAQVQPTISLAHTKSFNKIQTKPNLAALERGLIRYKSWVQKGHDVHRFFPEFKDKTLEKLYCDSALRTNLRGLSAGIVLHLVACMWLWHAVVHPDYGPDYFDDHGSAFLKKQMVLTQQLLSANFVASIGWSLLMLACMGNTSVCSKSVQNFMRHQGWLTDPSGWDLPEATLEANDAGTDVAKNRNHVKTHDLRLGRVCSFVLVLLKLQMLSICLVLGNIWPSRLGQTVIFALVATCNFGLGYCAFGVSFEGNCFLLASVAVATWIVADVPGGSLQQFYPNLKSVSPLPHCLPQRSLFSMTVLAYSTRLLFLLTHFEFIKTSINHSDIEEDAMSTFRVYLLIGMTLQVMASMYASRALSINARAAWIKVRNGVPVISPIGVLII